MNRVLIYTATYGGLLRRETLDSVHYTIFDGRWDYEVGYHNPHGDGNWRNIKEQMNRARGMVLDGGYDALLTVEHDMRIPPNALQLLAEAEAPVAYGVYVFRHGYTFLNTYEKLPAGSKGIGESLTVHPDKLARALKQNPAEVSGVGFGCTLIRRGVLEQLTFWAPESSLSSVDSAFARDCVRMGIRQVACWDVPCGHWNGRQWLMPFEPVRAEKITVTAVKDVTVRLDTGESFRMSKEQVYELSRNEAHELSRAGFVRVGGTT